MLCWASSSIIHHPPPLSTSSGASVYAVLCCAVPSPLPPSAARLLSSRLIWCGLVWSRHGSLWHVARLAWTHCRARSGFGALVCVGEFCKEVEIVWMEYHGVAVSTHGNVFFDECTG
ncbi:hypothetical protein HDV62DRAFT_375308 [Trichoderma sp. SZMC 28011]